MEDFRGTDEVTGRKLTKQLNKKKLSSQELDEIFLEEEKWKIKSMDVIIEVSVLLVYQKTVMCVLRIVQMSSKIKWMKMIRYMMINKVNTFK